MIASQICIGVIAPEVHAGGVARRLKNKTRSPATDQAKVVGGG